MMIHWIHRLQISVLGSGTKISVALSFWGNAARWIRYVNLLMHTECIIEGFVVNVEDTFVQCFFLK